MATLAYELPLLMMEIDSPRITQTRCTPPPECDFGPRDQSAGCGYPAADPTLAASQRG